MKQSHSESPCILVCSIEPQSGHCYGCGRNRNEIAKWQNMSEKKRTEILNVLPERLSKLERRPRRITRRARLKQARQQAGQQAGQQARQ